MVFAFSLQSGSGVWHPLVWLAAFAVAAIIARVVLGFGRGSRKTGGDHVKPFLSGNEELDEERIHVRASNLYWGYLEAMKGYYRRLTALHTGNVADYLLWLFGVLAIMIVVGLAT